VLAWCPSCLVHFNEVTLPTVERSRGAKPFDMTPFIGFLGTQLERLRPLLKERVDMRIALHRHPGAAGVVAAAEAVLAAVPGIELVDLKQPAVGLMSADLAALHGLSTATARVVVQAMLDDQPVPLRGKAVAPSVAVSD